MGILDRFRGKEPQVEILTKEPGFAVTRFTSHNPFTNLIAPETNYFDQYILYTAKCVDYISSKVASSDIDMYDMNDQELEDNPLYLDLKAFNPYMTLWEARKLREMHLMLTGAAYWYIDREPSTDNRVAFYPLDPINVTMNTDGYGLPGMFEYKDANGKIVQLPPEDVIYFRRVNPENWFEGLSILKTMTFWTNAYAQGSRYNMSKLGNNTNVDKFLVFPDVSDDSRLRIEAQLKEKYQGAKNAGRTAVVATKPEVVDVSSSQKDLDYVNGMKMLRQDIMVAFGIPEALFFPSATNANTKDAIRLFQSDTLEPLMEQEKATLNEQLITKAMEPKAQPGRVYFDFEGVVDADANELVEQAKKMVDAGIFTRDQALEYIGEDPIGGELGAEYPGRPGTAVDPNAQVDPNLQDNMNILEEKTKQLQQRLEAMISEKEMVEFIEKNTKLADDQEGLMYATAEALFLKQFRDAIGYLQKTEKPTVRGIFNHKQAVSDTKDYFRVAYERVLSNTNTVANTEIKQKMLLRGNPAVVEYRAKAITVETLNEIEKKLGLFADEISDTTAKALRKIMSEGLDGGFDMAKLSQQVSDAFNGFMDGVGNIEVLKKYGFYVESVTVNNEGGVVTASGNRYNQMLEKITQAQQKGEISGVEMTEALKALQGMINPADPIGKTVSHILETLYGIPAEKGISFSRAVTIARTEATFVRNLGFDDTYSNNPYIKGKMWNSALDKDTRDSHAVAHGQVVGIGEAFKVGDSKMRFPGDSTLGAGAEEIVNCRCRITAEVVD